jgi:hypothetical protein
MGYRVTFLGWSVVRTVSMVTGDFLNEMSQPNESKTLIVNIYCAKTLKYEFETLLIIRYSPICRGSSVLTVTPVEDIEVNG